MFWLLILCGTLTSTSQQKSCQCQIRYCQILTGRSSVVSTVIYFVLGAKGKAILQSAKPSFVIGFPKLEARPSCIKPTKASQQSNTHKAVAANGGEWMSTRPKATKRKKTNTSNGVAKKKKAISKTRKPAKQKVAAKKSTRSASILAKTNSSVSEVIDLLSDGDVDCDIDESSVAAPTLLNRNGSKLKTEDLWEDEFWDDDTDEEFD